MSETLRDKTINIKWVGASGDGSLYRADRPNWDGGRVVPLEDAEREVARVSLRYTKEVKRLEDEIEAVWQALGMDDYEGEDDAAHFVLDMKGYVELLTEKRDQLQSAHAALIEDVRSVAELVHPGWCGGKTQDECLGYVRRALEERDRLQGERAELDRTAEKKQQYLRARLSELPEKWREIKSVTHGDGLAEELIKPGYRNAADELAKILGSGGDAVPAPALEDGEQIGLLTKERDRQRQLSEQNLALAAQNLALYEQAQASEERLRKALDIAEGVLRQFADRGNYLQDEWDWNGEDGGATVAQRGLDEIGKALDANG
jgi:hypothetical protein